MAGSPGLDMVTDDTFEQEVIKSTVPVLVDFWADWCGPCRAITPILESIASDYAAKLRIVKLDVSANQNVPAQYNIRGIPTLLIFKAGEVAATYVGGDLSKSKLSAFIDNYL